MSINYASLQRDSRIPLTYVDAAAYCTVIISLPQVLSTSSVPTFAATVLGGVSDRFLDSVSFEESIIERKASAFCFHAHDDPSPKRTKLRRVGNDSAVVSRTRGR